MPFIETELTLESVPVGQSRCVRLGEAEVGLFHQPDGLFALDNRCPHRDAPLHEGFIHEGKVVCPLHQWEFHLKDGTCANIPKVRTRSYPVEVRSGKIWVNLES